MVQGDTDMQHCSQREAMFVHISGCLSLLLNLAHSIVLYCNCKCVFTMNYKGWCLATVALHAPLLHKQGVL